MAHENRWVTVAGAALALISVVALSGCSSSAEADTSGLPNLTLEQTKGPAQLLRNEAAGRIPVDAVEGVAQTEDLSEACQTLEADPKGLVRSWRSSVLMTINAASAPKVGSISDTLVKSFTDQGWVSSDRGSSTKVHIILLKSPTSQAEIHITATEDGDGDGVGAKMLIGAYGPCVETAGGESDGVTQLETEDQG